MKKSYLWLAILYGIGALVFIVIGVLASLNDFKWFITMMWFIVAVVYFILFIIYLSMPTEIKKDNKPKEIIDYIKENTDNILREKLHYLSYANGPLIYNTYEDIQKIRENADIMYNSKKYVETEIKEIFKLGYNFTDVCKNYLDEQKNPLKYSIINSEETAFEFYINGKSIGKYLKEKAIKESKKYIQTDFNYINPNLIEVKKITK